MGQQVSASFWVKKEMTEAEKLQSARASAGTRCGGVKVWCTQFVRLYEHVQIINKPVYTVFKWILTRFKERHRNLVSSYSWHVCPVTITQDYIEIIFSHYVKMLIDYCFLSCNKTISTLWLLLYPPEVQWTAAAWAPCGGEGPERRAGGGQGAASPLQLLPGSAESQDPGGEDSPGTPAGERRGTPAQAARSPAGERSCTNHRFLETLIW